jgi:hypothetical protein
MARYWRTFNDYEAVRVLISGALSEGLGQKVNATVRETVEAITGTLSPGSVDGSGYGGLDPSTALSPTRASKVLMRRGLVDLGSSATTAIR